MGVKLERILGRSEHAFFLPDLEGERVWVTGAGGSIGSRLVRLLTTHCVDVLGTDIDCDVRNWEDVSRTYLKFKPTIVLHMAGAKHAPASEVHPRQAVDVNVLGTMNMLTECANSRIVVASTCKAIEPETVYGATKLIAERAALAAGHSVARFHNVIETQGNVFEIWKNTPQNQPLRVASNCVRHFITLNEACAVVLWAAVLPSGRYAVDPGRAHVMLDVALRFQGGRRIVPIPARRGDRLVEPLHAVEEKMIPLDEPKGIVRVQGRHDA
jgi:FlaA1/EpsC-like NDP-sugar epimerase